MENNTNKMTFLRNRFRNIQSLFLHYKMLFHQKTTPTFPIKSRGCLYRLYKIIALNLFYLK